MLGTFCTLPPFIAFWTVCVPCNGSKPQAMAARVTAMTPPLMANVLWPIAALALIRSARAWAVSLAVIGAWLSLLKDRS